MRRKIKLSLIGLFLLLIVTIGLNSTFDGYFGFYYEDGNYEKPYAYSITEKIIFFPPVATFLGYTGMDTGYGFFAPNVASDFILLFDVKDSTGQSIIQTIMPRFRQKESRVRFTSVYNMFLEKISKDIDDVDKPYMTYLDIIIGQIADHVKKEYEGAVAVNAKLYLYDYPDIQNFVQGQSLEHAILITEITR